MLFRSGTATEVLLERRPADATLMPSMYELPPLPLDVVEGREPVLRVRHSITNTNYYVQVFAESAPGVAPAALHIAGEDETEGFTGSRAEPDAILADHGRLAPTRPAHQSNGSKIYEDDLYTPDDIPGLDADPRLTAPEGVLLAQVPASQSDLEWTPTTRLAFLPLTGLTRKVLQRLGVMPLPRLQLS